MKLNKPMLISFLLLIVVLVVGGACSNNSCDKSCDVEFTKWNTPGEGADCWKCNTPWNETATGAKCSDITVDGNKFPNPDCGLIPPEFYREGYSCTPLMCNALGKHCHWTESGDEGTLCLDQEDDIVALDLLDVKAEYTCKSGGCSVVPTPDGGLKITGQLEVGTDVNLLFKTHDASSGVDYPATCKSSIDILMAAKDFSNQDYFVKVDESYNLVHHNFSVSSPEGVVNEPTPHAYYISCGADGGEPDTPPITFEFTVAPLPDKYPPVIKYIEPELGMFKYGTEEADINIFVDDNSEINHCRWTLFSSDLKFDEMEVLKTMSCKKVGSTSMRQECKTKISGLTIEPQDFFFRCVDVEDNLNEDVQAFQYVASVTEELIINYISCPHFGVDECVGDIDEPTVDMTVFTSGGYHKEPVNCKISYNGGAYKNILETDSIDGEHFQPYITFPNAVNKYSFICKDVVGNEARKETTLNYKKDVIPPMITKIYSEGGLFVNIITDENTECRYTSNLIYVYEDADIISSADNITHMIGYSDEDSLFLVECRDRQGNSNKVEINLVNKV